MENNKNNKENNNKENKDKDIANVVRYSSLGIEFGSTVVLASFLGMYLDKKFNTLPLLTIIGIFFGFAFGVYRLYIIIKKINKK